MSKTPSWSRHTKSIGEAAVDGIGYGVLSGTLMGIYLLATAAAGGTPPAAALARFSAVGSDPTVLTGLVTHLAISAVYGALFGIAWRAAPLRRGYRERRMVILAGGLAYGALLFLVATLLLDVTLALSSQFQGSHLLIGHLLYGLGNGWLASRDERADENPFPTS